MRTLQEECKSGYIGSDVRAVENVSQYPLARAATQDKWQANSMVVGANAPSVLSGRTARASLHASCLQIIFIIGLILKVKVQGSKFKVKVPTCIRMTRHVSHIDNQRLTPCVPISAILHGNLTHFTFQYGSFPVTKWLRLRGNMEHIAKQCYGNGDVFVIDGALSPVILLHNRTQKKEYRRTPTLLTLNLIL